jgi:hypothetical protein
MSQAGVINIAGGGGGNIPTSFITDSGTVIPAGNIVNVNGGLTTSTQNNVNGISAIANPNNSNNMVVELTNRITGSVQTVGAATQILWTFPLGVTPGTYLFTNNTVGFNITDSTGAGYSDLGVFRTTGAAAILLGTSPAFVVEEGVQTVAEVFFTNTGNAVTLNVTGIAGKTIDWLSITTYIFRS